MSWLARLNPPPSSSQKGMGIFISKNTIFLIASLSNNKNLNVPTICFNNFFACHFLQCIYRVLLNTLPSDVTILY